MRTLLLLALVITLAWTADEDYKELTEVKREIGDAAHFDKTNEQLHKEVRGLQVLMRKNLEGVFATCQLVLFADMVDFVTAENKCENFAIGTYHRNPGNLATVNNGEKNLQIQLLLRMAFPDPSPKKWGKWVPEQWTWIGLRKIYNNTGIAWNKKYNENDWAWHDGSTPGDFNRWMFRMPDQKKLRRGRNGCKDAVCYQNQARVNHIGKWDDTFTFKTHPYTCDYQGRYILSNEPSHWFDAKRKCEAAGLEIAKVRNKYELDEMMAAAEYFLGPREEGNKLWNNTNWFWIGGNDVTVEGNWTWADGEDLPTDWALPWTHPWRTPNPDNAAFRGKGTQNALAMSKWGQWDDSFGTERRRNFACMCPGFEDAGAGYEDNISEES